MFNDYFFLQLFLVFLLGFLFVTTDLFFIVLNAVLFLALVSVYLWFSEMDVYVNFLVVIDLGVFFVLATLLVNFINLFRDFVSTNYSRFIFFSPLVFLFLINSPSLPASALFSNFSLGGVVFYDWFNLHGLNYFSDLQLFSDVYYIFSSYEFLVMNFYLYFAIILIFFLFLFLKLVELAPQSNPNKTNFSPESPFIKQQNFQKQMNQGGTVRAWKRKPTSNF